jgi:sigma-B regulation protein RsbU (phosphoserine phosphatase)
MPVKILVVDDEPDLELLITQKFRKKIAAGLYEFSFTRTGIEALEKLIAEPDIGIILTDINMPDMDGLTLLGKLQNLDRPYKAIIISAYGDMSNIRTAMNKGAADFVTKPIDFKDLEMTIDKTIIQFTHLKEGLFAKDRLLDIEKELDIAKRIQQAMLPKTFEIYRNFGQRFDILGTVLPAKTIGGDFFDFFALDDKNLGIIIADVSGKSISASLFMAITKTLFRSVAKNCLNCKEALENVNNLLSLDNPTCMFVTAFYAILNVETGVLSYANAGHTHPYLISKDSTYVEMCENNNSIPLGLDDELISSPELNFIQHTVQLKDQDCLFLYTDGVTEAMNQSKEMYTRQRLEEILSQHGSEPLESLIDEVIKDIKIFSQGMEQSDDITMFCLRYNATANIEDLKKTLPESQMVLPSPVATLSKALK